MKNFRIVDKGPKILWQRQKWPFVSLRQKIVMSVLSCFRTVEERYQPRLLTTTPQSLRSWQGVESAAIFKENDTDHFSCRQKLAASATALPQVFFRAVHPSSGAYSNVLLWDTEHRFSPFRSSS